MKSFWGVSRHLGHARRAADLWPDLQTDISLVLVGALFRDRTHRSAEELTEEVQAQSPDVNKGTFHSHH